MRLKLNGALGNVAQAQALCDRAQMNLHFHHRKELADTAPLPHRKREISKLMPLPNGLWLESLWPKRLGFRPELGMTVHEVRRHEDVRVRGDIVTADMVFVNCFSAEEPHRRVDS